MARLARYAHISPDQFGRMTHARTRQLDQHITKLLDSESEAQIMLARMIAITRGH